MLMRIVRAMPLFVAGFVVGGCSEKNAKEEAQAEEPKKAKKAKKSDDEEAPAAAVEEAAAPPDGANGAMATIPAGRFRAGSRCYDVPRATDIELDHEEISLGEFSMDLYPFPNEPGKPAMVNVTWQQAKELCEARGKRLCTELEWERACKGPESTTYMWGDLYGKNQKDCAGQKDLVTGQRPACKTKFGVMDMVGAGMEWTASDWERGTPSGHKVVRGARDDVVSWLSARCAHPRKRAPNEPQGDIGFRCCSGPQNSAKVSMRPKRDQTLELSTSIDDAFASTLMKSMPKDHREIADVELSFDEVHRWHPVAAEEMVIGRWRGQAAGGAPFYELAIFKVCGNRAWLAARMRGPVGSVGKPREQTDPRRLSFEVKTGAQTGEVKLQYWHGTVKLDQPSWIAEGNQLEIVGDQPAPTEKRRIPKIMRKKP
jgi:formylglycine-generating enzyme